MLEFQIKNRNHKGVDLVYEALNDNFNICSELARKTLTYLYFFKFHMSFFPY